MKLDEVSDVKCGKRVGEGIKIKYQFQG